MKVKSFTRWWKWTLRNYFILIFIGCIGFVGIVSVYKLFISKPTYVYVRVKMGQGLWWASTQKPSMWFVQAIQHVKEEKDLTGKPVVVLQKVVYYPWYGGSQYDIYVNAKLRVSKVGKAGKYNFKRSTIGVGTPIDFEFDTVQFSGTIIQLSDKPISEVYVEKTITLTKKGAFPWEYEAIQKGATVSNGETNIFTVLDKQATDTYSISGDQFGNYLSTNNESKKYITVKVKIKGKMEGDQFVFAEEQLISPGRGFSLSTSSFVFNDFMIAGIE